MAKNTILGVCTPSLAPRDVTQCHATASQRVVAGQQRNALNCCTCRGCMKKSIVISIEMVELVKCLLPPVQNEHISWWFFLKIMSGCLCCFSHSDTQIRSMLRCLKAWHRSDMILVPVWLQSVFNFYLHQWSMIHNLKGNTHVDLHLSSPVYTDTPILSSYHLDKLKNWLCS